jgi:hypothetical protein
LTEYQGCSTFATAAAIEMQKSSTTRCFTSRFSLSCAWAYPRQSSSAKRRAAPLGSSNAIWAEFKDSPKFSRISQCHGRWPSPIQWGESSHGNYALPKTASGLHGVGMASRHLTESDDRKTEQSCGAVALGCKLPISGAPSARRVSQAPMLVKDCGGDCRGAKCLAGETGCQF